METAARTVLPQHAGFLFVCLLCFLFSFLFVCYCCFSTLPGFLLCFLPRKPHDRFGAFWWRNERKATPTGLDSQWAAAGMRHFIDLACPSGTFWMRTQHLQEEKGLGLTNCSTVQTQRLTAGSSSLSGPGALGS